MDVLEERKKERTIHKIQDPPLQREEWIMGVREDHKNVGRCFSTDEFMLPEECK